MACYYYAPNWDIPPPSDGRIGLGNVIASPEKLEYPLHVAPFLLFLKTEGDVNGGLMSTTKKTRVEYLAAKLREGKLSVLTRFLSILVGLGVDVELEGSKKFVALASY